MIFIDFLFPKECLGCKREGVYLCKNCLIKVGYAKQVCQVCTKPSIDGITHVKCRKAWNLDGRLSVWNYKGVIRKALLRTKYYFAADISGEIAENMADYLHKNITALPKKALLVPIPLHKKRQRWRGFNQSVLMGQKLANKMNWSFSKDLVIRKTFSTPQTQLKGEERIKNVKDVFGVSQEMLRSIGKGCAVIVFDDVVTTGATLKELSKVLKREGINKVWGLTTAKT